MQYPTDYDILKQLTKWMKYILECEPIDWHDFDQVQYIYNSCDVYWNPTPENRAWAAKVYAVITNAFNQYKLLAEKADINKANPRISVIFNNLQYSLRRLEFWNDDDSDDDDDDTSSDEDVSNEESIGGMSDKTDLTSLTSDSESDADIMDTVTIIPRKEYRPLPFNENYYQ